MRKNVAIAWLVIVAAAGWFAAWQSAKQRHLAEAMLAASRGGESGVGHRVTAGGATSGGRIHSPAGSSNAAPVDRNVATSNPQIDVAPKEGDPAYFRRVVEDPNVAPWFSAQQRFQLESKYKFLLMKLGLTPDERNAFLLRLVEKRITAMDVSNVAEANGLKPNDASILQGFAQANADTDQAIHALLGDQRFSLYQDYDKNIAQWNMLFGVDREIALSGTPLNEVQAEVLVKITAEPPKLTSSDPEGMDAYAAGYADWIQTVRTQASGVLTAEQMAALNRYYEQMLVSIRLKAALQHPEHGSP